MERQSYYFLIALIALAVCIGVFWFQFNNDVATFMILNETEVQEGASFSGMLMDSYSQAVANQTIIYHEPGSKQLINTQTDENGEFTIENAKYVSDNPDDNYYGNFTFAGADKYAGCVYEGNVTVKAK